MITLTNIFDYKATILIIASISYYEKLVVRILASTEQQFDCNVYEADLSHSGSN